MYRTTLRFIERALSDSLFLLIEGLIFVISLGVRVLAFVVLLIMLFGA